MIRNTVFKYADNIGNSGWRLYSDPFNHDGMIWNVKFDSNQLRNAKNSAEAVKLGNQIFKHSALVSKPEMVSPGKTIQCKYSPGSASYGVYVDTPPDYGFKQ